MFPNCPDNQLSCDAPVVGDTVTLYDDFPSPPVPMTFAFGANPDDFLTGRKTGATTPVCTQSNPRRCIPGKVVNNFENATQVPRPEEDALHMVYVVTEMDYKYPRETRSYTAGFQGCCRLGQGDNELRNNADGAWYLRTVVSLTDNQQIANTGTAASAFVNHIPTVNAIKGRPSFFKMHAFDPASRPITFKLGTNDDQGIGLNPGAQPPFGNTMAATINAVTGQVTFPASAATSYEQFYHMVVIATVVGPCTEFDQQNPALCLNPSGQPQTSTITTIVDFMVHVIYAGFTGLPPTASCSNGDSGLPRGSLVCNNQPLLTVPTSVQRFICGEPNQFTVTAQDGIGNDKSISIPEGAFAIRHRQQLVLEGAYPTDPANLPSFPLTDAQCCIRSYAAFNATIPGPNKASGVFRWHPVCERLEDNVLYGYAGRHRLDVFSACFVSVDEAAYDAWGGKLTSPPGCVGIHLLRCTKPTVSLAATSSPAANETTRTYTVFVATNITFHLNASDDVQTRHLRIDSTADPGVPAVGSQWHDPGCSASSPPSGPVVCNPSTRAFTFSAELVHAGSTSPVLLSSRAATRGADVRCVTARIDHAPVLRGGERPGPSANPPLHPLQCAPSPDWRGASCCQVECPRYRANTGPQALTQHAGPGITVSQVCPPNPPPSRAFGRQVRLEANAVPRFSLSHTVECQVLEPDAVPLLLSPTLCSVRSCTALSRSVECKLLHADALPVPRAGLRAALRLPRRPGAHHRVDPPVARRRHDDHNLHGLPARDGLRCHRPRQLLRPPDLPDPGALPSLLLPLAPGISC